MTAASAARRPAAPDPHGPYDRHDALGAALDDALARVVPALAAPPAHRVALRDALLALLAAVDRRAPLPVMAAERALAPLERWTSRDGAGPDPALAALRALLDRARALAA